MATLLITVGSTRFQALTDAILSLAESSSLAPYVKTLIVQAGDANLPPALKEGEQTVGGTRVNVIRYTRDAGELEALIACADGVVSHAGSGTILQVLRRANAPRLVVVPNPALMDNHQQELADALRADGYLDVSDVDGVLDAIARMLDPKAAPPIPFPAFDPARFAAVIDEVAGFA